MSRRSLSKQAQVRATLLEMMASLSPHDKLPSENELAAKCQVHRLTARKAISDLVAEGKLYRRHGKGTFLAESEARTARKCVGCLLRPMRPRRSDDNYFLEVFESIESELATSGHLMIYKAMSTDPLANRHAFEELLAAGVCSIIVDERIDDAQLCAFPAPAVPVVIVNRTSSLPFIRSVAIDNTQTLHKIVEYVHANGHKRIMFIFDQGTHAERDRNQIERRDAFIVACDTLGIAASERHLQPAYENTFDGKAYRDATIEGFRTFKPTVIVTAFDWIAINSYRALQEAGLCIPDDISIVSIGDYAFAAELDPPLSTARIDTNRLGRETVRLALSQDQQRVLIPTDLIERASCACVHETVYTAEKVCP